MTDNAPDTKKTKTRRLGLGAKIAVGLVALVILVVAAAVGLVVGVDTAPGRAFLVRQVNAFTLDTGLNVQIGRIDGSLYGAMRVHDLKVRDTKGVFVVVPDLTLDWRPLAYLHRQVDVRLLSAPVVQVLRQPALKPTPPKPSNGPLLPDINVAIGKVAIDQLILEAPVAGQRHVGRLQASADLADGRVKVSADAGVLRAAGLAGGDSLTLRLDAEPKANKLLIQARVMAPAGGLIDSYAKLGKPLDLAIDGQGDWANWAGKARTRLGDKVLADLDLTARNGTFRVAGQAMPGVILTGPAADLTAPAITLDLTAVLHDRAVDTKLTARSDAFTIAALGLVDLGKNRFGGVKIDARLIKPGVLAKGAAARDAALSLTVDGPFATPVVGYSISAAQAAFGTTGIEGLQASGKARIDTGRILIPVNASIRRMTGIDPSIGDLLRDVKVDGQLAISGGRILSDNLRLRSSGINATAILVADPARALYTAAIKGRLNGYHAPGFGIVDLVTDAKLTSGKTGGFGIKGNVRATTRRLDNAGLKDFLGGNGVLTADVSMNEKGVITLGRMRVDAPKFKLTQARGTYQPNGRLTFNAAGASTAYGPFTLAASGTIARPVATFKAASPGLGAEIKDVEIDLKGLAEGYAIQAKANSAYGPLAGDVLVHAGKGPLAVDIHSASAAGITAKGAITQTAAGPFAGTLTFAGSGLDGSVRLGAEGKVQRADAEVRAKDARIPIEPAVTVASGAATVSAVLYPEAPMVTADAKFAGVRQGALNIANAQARVRYQNGKGTVGLVADGRSGVPFNIAAQASLSPDRIQANLKGAVNGLAMRLAGPVEIVKAGSGWRLGSATLMLPKGEVQISGQTGERTELHAALRNLDLSILQTFSPEAAIQGQASGQVDVVMPPGDAIPTVKADLAIAHFARTGLATDPAPVDIALNAGLSAAAGGDARAVIRRSGTVVGRLDARLSPIPGGTGPWMDRLMAAPLSGGIRYNGPSELLWSFTGVAGQSLTGGLAIAADFGGRISKPTLTGVIRSNALRYENPTYGTVVSDIAIQGRFDASSLQLTSLTAKAGSGSLSGKGSVGLDAEGGFPIDLQITLNNAQLARSEALGATVSGTVSIVNGKDKPATIHGDLRIPDARYQIVRQAAADVADLEGVRRKGAPPPTAATAQAGGLPANWALDIRVRADNRVFVSGMGLEAEWRTDLRVSGTAAKPVVLGELEVVRGTYGFAGREFQLTKGVITFDGIQLLDPQLDISASTTVEGVAAIINITGRAQAPQIAFTSTPTLPQDEVLSRILFGSSIASLSPTQAIQLAVALNSLRGSGGGLNPLGKLRSAGGVDRLRVLGADEATGRGTSLAAGKYIAKNVYVEIITDARGFTATQLEIGLSRALSILSQTGSFGGSNFSVRYSKDY